MTILPTTFGFLFILLLLAMYEIADLKHAECMRMIYWEQLYEEESKICNKLHKKADAAYFPPGRNANANPEEDYESIDQDEATIAADTGSTEVGAIPGSTLRNTRFLHIGSLFDFNPNNKNDKKKEDVKRLLISLIRVLYEKEDFFKKAEAQYPELDKVLVEKILEKAEEAQIKKVPIKSAKDLARLDLEDKVLKYAFYRVMKGTKPRRKGSEKREGYFNLCEFVTFKNQNAAAVASIWLAPKPVLMALFGDEGVVENVCRKREEIKRRTKKAESQELKDLGQELENDFASALSSEIKDHSVISFRVTSTEPRDW